MKPQVPLLLALFSVSLVYAEDSAQKSPAMGSRAVWEIQSVQEDRWDIGEKASYKVTSGQLQLELDEGTFGWVAPRDASAYLEGAELSIDAEDITGALFVQLEYISKNDIFLGASEICRLSATSAVPLSKPLADHLPPNVAKKDIYWVRPKIWLEGEEPSATVTELSIRAPRRFVRPGTTLASDFSTGRAHNPALGMRIEVTENKALDLSLDGVENSSFLYEGGFEYKTNQLLAVDLSRMENAAATVQLLAYKGEELLGSLDLLSGEQATGLHEIPLELLEEEIPEGTESFAVKIWLTGTGEDPSGRLGGIWIGEQD